MFNLIPQTLVDLAQSFVPCEYLVKDYLSRLTYGCIHFNTPTFSAIYGDEKSSKVITLNVLDTKFYKKVIFRQDIGLGEAYFERMFECDDCALLIEILIYNMRTNVTPMGSSNLSKITTSVGAIARWIWTNGRAAALSNVEYHYELGNDFYLNFLDKDTLGYTCGLYMNPEDTCAQAQWNKFNLLISKLELKPTDRLLELGCGWGALMILAAEKIGCTCVGYSLSNQQCTYIRDLVTKKGLQDKIRVVEADYRTIPEKEKELFDKVVTVGMIEHIGHYDIPTILSTADRMMKPNGIFVSHHITTLDQRYESYRKDRDFIKEYIFPGCCIPSPTAVLQAATLNTRLTCQHMENFGHNYTQTLKDWKAIFNSNLKTIKKLSPQFDEKFIRMWNFYLDYSIGGFHTNQLGLYQMVWKRPTMDDPFPDGRLDDRYSVKL